MRGIRISVALLLASSCTTLLVAPSAWAGEAADTFCQAELLRAYEAPLQGLPRTRESPSGGTLGWASKRLYFHRENDGVVVGGEPILYDLALGGAKYGDLRLDWKVESELVRIDPHGRPREVAMRRVERVDGMAPGDKRSLGFRGSPRPGLYRYDISFAKGDDRLARYSDYYRVVRRSTDVRLALNGSTFQPGERILAKVENFGTELILYGVAFRLEQYDGGAFGCRLTSPLSSAGRLGSS